MATVTAIVELIGVLGEIAFLRMLTVLAAAVTAAMARFVVSNPPQ